ncbi:hypothetical protein [Gordonia alkanivorans]|nr:hypothetical protein [Gordonia alkanivorans]
MKSLILGTVAATMLTGTALALGVAPADAAPTVRVTLASPQANTLLATMTNDRSADQGCYVSFYYGPVDYKTPTTRVEAGQTRSIRVTDLPAGRYAVYVNCGALQVHKENVTVTGKPGGTPRTEVVASPPSGLSSALTLFGSS